MKCFIHINDEAVAVCKQCGKAMCGNCSAYTNHSGICPECRRTEFIQECNILSLKLKKNKASIAASIAVAAVFAVSAVVLAVIVHVILFFYQVCNKQFRFYYMNYCNPNLSPSRTALTTAVRLVSYTVSLQARKP